VNILLTSAILWVNMKTAEYGLGPTNITSSTSRSFIIFSDPFRIVMRVKYGKHDLFDLEKPDDVSF
jgi:hypothetical protein